MKKIKPYIVGAVAGIVMYAFIFAIFHPFVVSGPSMEPTFHDQNFVISEKVKGDYSVGDVAIVIMDGRKCIKRVVALPGETINIKDGILYVNGEAVSESFEPMEEAGMFDEPYTLQEDEYAFLGDNRNNSLDSRYYGPVKRDHILYRVTKKII